MLVMKVSVVYDNLPKFQASARAFTRIGAGVFAEGMLRDMRSLVPVRTGALRDGLSVVESTQFVAGTMFHVGIVSRQPYWEFVEYGTSRMASRPFIGPAIEMNLPAFRSIMAKHVSDACLQLAGPATVGMR